MPRTHTNLPRLFISPDLEAGAELVLDKDQSLYLVAVLRKTVSDEVVVFNGRDGAWRARLTSASKKSVALVLAEQIAPQIPPSDFLYCFAPLKTGRLDYMIQKATEMGAGVIQPVFTQHTQISRLKHERLLANAIEAAEQCEVLNIPKVETGVTLEQLLYSWPDDRKLILADEGASSSSPVNRLAPLREKKLGLLIGPEGGFSGDERKKLLALPFIVPISLGPRILRADTAAVAAMAVIQAIIGDWR